MECLVGLGGSEMTLEEAGSSWAAVLTYDLNSKNLNSKLFII